MSKFKSFNPKYRKLSPPAFIFHLGFIHQFKKRCDLLFIFLKKLVALIINVHNGILIKIFVSSQTTKDNVNFVFCSLSHFYLLHHTLFLG